MTPGEIARYLGLALLYASLVFLVIFLLSRIAASRFGVRLNPRQSLTILLILFFVFLTQHPFPDRATLDCTTGGAPSILVPFGFLARLYELWERGAGLSVWGRDKVVLSSAMNFGLCAAIGASLSGQITGRWAHAKIFGFASLLSVGVELAQLTGLFGFYPCAYRQFEIDDLILNIGGVMAGFTMAARVFRMRR